MKFIAEHKLLKPVLINLLIVLFSFLVSATKIKVDKKMASAPSILFENNVKSFMKNYKMNGEDSMSYSQENGLVQKHLHFEVYIDMDKKMMQGLVRIDYSCLGSTNFIGLDIRDLVIVNVKDKNQNILKYYILKNTKNSIGDGLNVQLNSICQIGEKSSIEISYLTKPGSLGTNFSDPQNLHNKERSFLYTHGEAIYSRTFFPSQDSPSLKVTSSAKLRIKEPYTALFSGLLISKTKVGDGIIEYHYELDNPISTYLITFAAGVIIKKEIANSRCEVWGEEEALRWVNESFKYCEAYLKFYETYKPFAFKKMTFLIVPDDFPFSGMENPYVVYISESVLSKDLSYTNVIAHEIVHFWSGNLVTNKNWESFWLNEGITTYLNRKAIRTIHGDDSFYFELYNGLHKLESALKEMKNKNLDASLSSLSPKYTDDPYITFSRIPYEKGAFFMYYLETLVGDEVMHKILSDYFNTFQFSSVTSDTFIKLVKSKIRGYRKDGESIIKKVDWMEWLHGNGMIPVDFNIKSEKVENFKQHLQIFKTGEKTVDELKSILESMKILEKDRIIKELTVTFNNLSSETKTKIKSLSEIKSLFNEHIILQASSTILTAYFIENSQDKEKVLIESFNNLNYFKVHHMRKVFSLLKEINPDKTHLTNILAKIEKRLNPITVMRIKEYINLPLKKKNKELVI